MFVNRTDDVEKVVELLKRAGITAEGFSARLDQAERKKRLDRFKSDDSDINSLNILVSADLLSRGHDFPDVGCAAGRCHHRCN